MRLTAPDAALFTICEGTTIFFARKMWYLYNWLDSATIFQCSEYMYFEQFKQSCIQKYTKRKNEYFYEDCSLKLAKGQFFDRSLLSSPDINREDKRLMTKPFLPSCRIQSDGRPVRGWDFRQCVLMGFSEVPISACCFGFYST